MAGHGGDRSSKRMRAEVSPLWHQAGLAAAAAAASQALETWGGYASFTNVDQGLKCWVYSAARYSSDIAMPLLKYLKALIPSHLLCLDTICHHWAAVGLNCTLGGVSRSLGLLTDYRDTKTSNSAWSWEVLDQALELRLDRWLQSLADYNFSMISKSWPHYNKIELWKT